MELTWSHFFKTLVWHTPLSTNNIHSQQVIMTLLLMVGERSLLPDTGDSTSGEPTIAPNEDREGSLVEEGGVSARTLPATSCDNNTIHDYMQHAYNCYIERYSNKKTCDTCTCNTIFISTCKKINYCITIPDKLTNTHPLWLLYSPAHTWWE